MKTLVRGAGLGFKLRSSSNLSTILAAGVMSASVLPAYADISNTATVSGTAPGGTPGAVQDVSDQVDVSVDPVTPSVAVTKTITNTGSGAGGDFVAGDVISYSFTVTNDGNSYLRDVGLSDNLEGPGAITPVFTAGAGGVATLTDNNTVTDSTDDGADNSWDLLAPGDAVNFIGTYTVTADDVANNGYDADGELDNEVTALASATVGGVNSSPSDTASAAAALEVTASLDLVKAASTPGPVAPGDNITYTYTVTNNGTVPITNISISDIHEDGQGNAVTFDSTTGTIGTNPGEWQIVETTAATSGPANDDSTSSTDGVWDQIGVGGVITFTYIHTVTQDEVDAQ